MSEDKTKHQEPHLSPSDEELLSQIGMLRMAERSFFQILREDFPSRVLGRKKRRKQR
jgi:hypothetical protein